MKIKYHEKDKGRNQKKCKQAKSDSCKGRRLNNKSESANNRMEKLLFYQDKRKAVAGTRLVHYLNLYKMVQQETSKAL